jgi:hypothetical protein
MVCSSPKMVVFSDFSCPGRPLDELWSLETSQKTTKSILWVAGLELQSIQKASNWNTWYHFVVIWLQYPVVQLRFIFNYNNPHTILVLCQGATLHIALSFAQWRLPIKTGKKTQYQLAKVTQPRKTTRLCTQFAKFLLVPLPHKVHPLAFKLSGAVFQSLISQVHIFSCSWMGISMNSLNSSWYVSFLSAMPVVDRLKL